MALQRDRKTARQNGHRLSAPVAAATRVFAGSIVAIDAAGNAVPAGTPSAQRVVGVALTHVDNRDGEDGDRTVLVARGVYAFNVADGMPDFDGSSIGSPAYAVDDESVTAGFGEGAPLNTLVAGVIVDIDDEGVWIDFAAGTFAAAEAYANAQVVASQLGQRTLTVTHDDLDASADSQVFNLGDTLPAGARVLGVELEVTPFTGGSATKVDVSVGLVGASDSVLKDANLFTGAVSKSSGRTVADADARGQNPHGNVGGAQLVVTVTSDVNVELLNAGSFTLDVLYGVPA